MSRPIWIFGIVILALVVFTLWLGLSTRRNNDAIRAEVQITPRGGGTVMPTSSPTPEPTSTEVETNDVTNDEANDTTNDEANDATDDATNDTTNDGMTLVLTPGQSVLLESETRGLIPLYADATVNAPTLNVYPTGAQLTILEPSGEYNDYPVQNDDADWYRVRAEDGLVGWIDARRLMVTDAVPAQSSTPTPTE